MSGRIVVDPGFGTRMRQIREERGLSLRNLERPTLASKSKLHKIETGVSKPTHETARLIDDALNAGGELIAMVHPHHPFVMPRREFLGTATAAAAVPEVVCHHLAAGTRIGDEVVRQLITHTARLRRLDDYLGGADTFGLFAREVAATTRLMQDGDFHESTGRGLLSVLAEQAQLAGWAAFDAGWHADAYRMFDLSLQAAKDAAEPALTGNAFAFIGYQRLATGRSAVDDLTTACEIAGRGATPRVRTLLHCRLAWAYASERQVREAERHLDLAAAALEEPRERPEPDWVYWVDDLEHRIMTGRCWAALRRPVRAITVLERAISAYQDTHGRDKALYLSFLADAYLDANEIESACMVASRAIDLCAGVGSVRPRQRIEFLLGRMNGDARPVVELRAKVEEWASSRSLSAIPSSGTPEIPELPASL
jgi:transcriptional regulator with XRE-family HTH domain